MVKKTIFAGKPGAPLSKAVQANGFLFLTGHVGGPVAQIDATDIRAQTRGTLENLKRTLGECDAGLEDVVRATVYLTDMGDFTGMNEVYREYFPADPPARSTIGVKDLGSPEYRIEIDLIAAVE